MLVEFKLFAFIPKGFEVHSAAEPFHAVAENKHKLIIVLFHPEYFDSFMAHGS
jgi:GMP synthase-like glutamine amidotransferase